MAQNRRLKRTLCYIIAVLIFLFGVFIFVYPFAQRAFTDKNITQTLESFRFVRSVYGNAEDAPIKDANGEITQTEYQKRAANLSADERNRYNKSLFNELKDAMQDYNEKIYDSHQAGLKDAWSYEEAAFDLTKYGVYDNVVAELRIPAMDCDLPLYLGATWNNMAWGAVQLGKTSMPIGGKNTNCVIAAHRGCTNGEYFLHIQNLHIGDKIYVDNLWETLTYKVTEIKIISPDDIPSILIQEGKDMVTLITCHPYPYNYQRYAVFCERTANDSDTNGVTETERQGNDEIQNSSDSFIQFENTLIYAVPIFILLLAVVLFSLTSKRHLRRKRKQKRASTTPQQKSRKQQRII